MIKRVSIYYRNDNKQAVLWATKINRWLKKRYPQIVLDAQSPQALIVLGGDGTILEASRKYQKKNPLIVGFNLGRVGFLTSVRDRGKFLESMKRFFAGKFRVVKRMMISAEVYRKNKKVFFANSLNDVLVHNLLGVAEIKVNIDGHPVQYIRGTGLLVATSTGSTAYNLSAHGPIIMPDIKCMVLTEILDHNIPTPSIVVKRDREIELEILQFRRRKFFKLAQSGRDADVVISADGENVFPLESGDIIKVKRSLGLVKFVEFEHAYFFKSLQKKFGFR
jgi:NAD+ kinase